MQGSKVDFVFLTSMEPPDRHPRYDDGEDDGIPEPGTAGDENAWER
jgi:hypothetical protein